MSRNLHARKYLARDIQQRFRKNNSNSSGQDLTESKKQRIIENYVGDRNKFNTNAYRSPRSERLRLIEKFNQDQVNRERDNTESEKRSGIEFVYNHYDVYNTTYIPVFDIIDKFSSGDGIDEILGTVRLDDSLKKLGSAF